MNLIKNSKRESFQLYFTLDFKVMSWCQKYLKGSNLSLGFCKTNGVLRSRTAFFFVRFHYGESFTGFKRHLFFILLSPTEGVRAHLAMADLLAYFTELNYPHGT